MKIPNIMCVCVYIYVHDNLASRFHEKESKHNWSMDIQTREEKSVKKFTSQIIIRKKKVNSPKINFILIHTIASETSCDKRSSQESTADFQLSMSFWSVGAPEDSERRWWVLMMEMTLESWEGLPSGCLSSGTCSLMRLRSRRGRRATSFMSLTRSKAAIEVQSLSSELWALQLRNESVVRRV